MDMFFYAGLALVAITFFIGLSVAKPYDAYNFQQVASTQRKLCLSYVAGFGAMAFGGPIILGDAWWAWLIIGISGMCGFGAFLEAMKTLPNAPKDMQQD